MSFVRDSKFRHVFGEAWKTKYDDIQYTTKATESVGLRCNGKFLVIPWTGGGGPLAVLPVGKLGKVPRDVPRITGHTAPVLDFEFNPFDDNMLISASEDHTIKVWALPDEGLKDHLKDPVATLEGHEKKVGFCTFNPSAADIVASTSFDMTCKVWNVAAQEVAFSTPVPDQMLSLRWNYRGSMLAGTCKDKRLHIMDPRADGIVSSVSAHEGVKASKVIWLGGPGDTEDNNCLLTTGFSRHTDRQVGIWDIRMFSSSMDDRCEPLSMTLLDQGAASLYPHYDPGTGMLYIAGKGDAMVKYFEVARGHQELHFLSQYTSTSTQKAFDFIPKRNVDVSRHELARGLRLEGTCVQPISFCVPRRSEAFQDDIFPDCPSATPAMQAADWAAGAAAQDPVLQSMRPGAASAQAKAAPQRHLAQVVTAIVAGQRVKTIVKGAQQPGTVRYVGEIENQAGTWVGIELDKPEGKHDGQLGDRRYFDCPESCGTIVRASQLAVLQEDAVDAPNAADLAAAQSAFKEGESVSMTLTGTVKFVGGTQFASGVWLGLELDEGAGRCNGSMLGVPYFRCAEGRGLLLQPPRIVPEASAAVGSQQPSACKASDAVVANEQVEKLRSQVAEEEGKSAKFKSAMEEKRAQNAKLAAALEAAHKRAEQLQDQLEAEQVKARELESQLAQAATRERALQKDVEEAKKAAVAPQQSFAPPGRASTNGEAAGDDSKALSPPPPRKPMTYKEQREQAQRQLEDTMSAPSGFRGKQLTAEEADIIERKGTEAAGAGEYNSFAPQRGYFACRKCGRPIYSCEAKFKSGCGWPAFDKCYTNSIATRKEDDGTDRVEITCAGCGGHLGHIFEESNTHDKRRSDQRHCANSLALQYIKDEPPAGTGGETTLDLNASAAPSVAPRAPPEEQRGPPPPALPAAAPQSLPAPRSGVGEAFALDLSRLQRLVSNLERCADLFAPACRGGSPDGRAGTAARTELPPTMRA